MAILNFNANDVEPVDNDFAPLPVGDYKMVITSSEIKETRDNPDNKYIKFTFDVIEGKYKGRKIFENMNLWRAGNTEKDKTTIKIAQQNISSLVRATVGKLKNNDTSEMYNIPLIVTLKIKPASGGYGESNAVKGYKSINGGNTLHLQAEAPKAEENSGGYVWDN